MSECSFLCSFFLLFISFLRKKRAEKKGKQKIYEKFMLVRGIVKIFWLFVCLCVCDALWFWIEYVPCRYREFYTCDVKIFMYSNIVQKKRKYLKANSRQRWAHEICECLSLLKKKKKKIGEKMLKVNTNMGSNATPYYFLFAYFLCLQFLFMCTIFEILFLFFVQIGLNMIYLRFPKYVCIMIVHNWHDYFLCFCLFCWH